LVDEGDAALAIEDVEVVANMNAMARESGYINQLYDIDRTSGKLEDTIEIYNALLSHFLHIPFPEQLPDSFWLMKVKQFEFLFFNNYLPIKPKE
jgi:hypothetical protein